MEKNSLILNCWGGLGNQLFEYAAGLFFSGRTGRSIEVVSPSERNAHWNGYPRPFQMGEFAVSHLARTPTLMDRVFLSTQPRIRAVASLIGPPLGARTVVEPQSYQFHPHLLDDVRQKRVFLNGFWQSAHYANSQEAVLRQEFDFTTKPTGRNAEYATLIRSLPCAVSVHLRIGDYAQIKNTAQSGSVTSLVLTTQYYMAAISEVRKRFGACTLVAFSDDEAAARELLSGEKDCLFVEGNTAQTAHEDLRLMSLCRHHILANSSFSWWGAWLNSKPDKQVFVPKYWGNTRESYYPELFAEGWTVIDNLA